MKSLNKILFVSLSAPTNIGANGGAQIYILHLAQQLVKMGLEITIVGLNETRNGILYPNKEEINGIKVLRLGKGKLKIFQLRKWVKINQHDFDVVVENMMQFPLLLPLVLKKSTKYYIIKHHFLDKDSFKILGYVKGLINVINEKIIIPLHIKPFIVPSKFTASFLKQNSFVSDSKEILINPPGIEVINQKINRTEHPSILYTGTLNINRKKVDHLIEAFKTISHKIPNVELIICGDGPSKTYLEELAMGYNVDFKGYVSLEEKMKLYASSWVFASPSLMEGFGITWIEAGYFKLPVVVYDIGIDTVDSSCAALVELNSISGLTDKIYELLTNKDLRCKMGEEGYLNAKKFSWENNAKRFVSYTIE
jgi:glycosyltransferase involved in cell wall biosynthesis